MSVFAGLEYIIIDYWTPVICESVIMTSYSVSAILFYEQIVLLSFGLPFHISYEEDAGDRRRMRATRRGCGRHEEDAGDWG